MFRKAFRRSRLGYFRIFCIVSPLGPLRYRYACCVIVVDVRFRMSGLTLKEIFAKIGVPVEAVMRLCQ